MHIQPRLEPGKFRLQLPSSVDPRIIENVERDAVRWDCSKSWIVATALAAFYGIQIEIPVAAKRKRHKRRTWRRQVAA